ncbi:MAG: hypothetical protein F6K22_26685 [Okeania sp. SIO2F4]|nr:caspase family protein [Okeania sp. SIO2F4]NES06076.1 hypothetical protein [Okeania sp. SIO2F4]
MVRIKRNLAIIIGIDRYLHIPKLKNAVFDAQELADVLQEKHNYQVLRLFDELATKEKFSQLLENLQNNKIELEGKLTQIEKSDRLLFYFAGHGFDEEAEDSEEGKPAGYFMPQDADANDNKTWLSMKKVYETLTELHCHHLLIILDCCFAGRISWVSKGRNAARPRKLYKQNYDRFIKHSTQQIITSAGHDEKALDSFRFGKRGGGDNKHSPFAYFLLKILKADSNRGNDKFIEAIIDDKVITVHELFTYLQNELGKVTEGQTSTLVQPRKYDKEIGEYVFLKGEYIFPLANFKRDKLEEFKLDENTNPYKGLASFDAKDSQLFYGRKQLIEEPKEGLIAKVSENPLTVVLGVSGSGKSSLVKAGLISKLRSEQEKEASQDKWYVLNPIRPGEVPLTALARAILPIKNVNLVNELTQVKFLDNLLDLKIKPEQESKLNDESKDFFNILVKAWSGEIPEAKILLILDNFEKLKKICNDSEKQLLEEFKNNISNTLNSLIEELKQNSQSLTAIVNQWSQNNPNIKLLLTIDQSEELITLCQNDQDRENFLHLLAEALASKELSQNLRIVLTLRSDFEPQLRDLNEDKYKDADWQKNWQKNWQDGRFIVTPMNREELQQVIEEPAAQRTLFFESPKLVNALIDEVIQMPGALPLLSFTLSQLYLKYLKAEENKERDDRTITEADYQDTGGVKRSLIKTADDTYNKLVN